MARCDGCEAEAAGCPRPVVREIRLGMGRRLFDVDENGRFGLVGTMLGFRKVYDLDAGSFARSGTVPRTSRIMHDGTVFGVRPRWEHPRKLFRISDEDEEHRVSVEGPLDVDQLYRAGDFLCALYSDDQVELFELGRAVSTLGRGAPSAESVHRIAFDPASRTLVAACWDRIYLSDVRRNEIVRRDSRPAEGAMLRWLGITETIVLGIDEAGRLIEWSRALRGAPGRHIRASAIDRRVAAAGFPASLHPNGELLAFAAPGQGLATLDVTSGQITARFGGHTDRINLVRFIDGGARLLSADYDNRVLIRPWVGDRYLGAS